MTYQERTEFIDYCFDFYGAEGIYDMGMTRNEIAMGLLLRLEQKSDVEFEGDTVDRELVRDCVIAMRNGN